MRLYSAYISRRAAEDANSIFESERHVKRIYKDGVDLWELAKKEEHDDLELEHAEEISEIPAIIDEEKKEIKDIEDLVNQTFKVIRDGILVIHTQLDQLRKLLKEDDVLEHSGFPIEVANQLEEMLSQEIKRITSHLHKMGRDIDERQIEGDNNSSS